jgi:uncharacterized protein YfaS (alpha-2-macroglobulin family)/tetratricopeptide (TPR) repeat protein
MKFTQVIEFVRLSQVPHSRIDRIMEQNRFWPALIRAAVCSLFCTGLLGYWLMAEEAKQDLTGTRQKALQGQKDGNFKDAFEAFQKLTLDPKDDRLLVAEDLANAIQCLRQLNRVDEVDDYREKVIETHKANWRLLQGAAKSFLQGDNYGYIIAGKFSRGHRRGGGRYINSHVRDRVRGLQLLTQAMPLLPEEPNKADIAQFYYELANGLVQQNDPQNSWRLQILTDLKTLPDHEDAQFEGGGAAGAPVGADGNPVYYKVPESFEAAKSDGERWRWALAQVAVNAPGRAGEMQMRLADFLRAQFDVQTMAEYNWFFRGGNNDQEKTPTYSLETLGEDETLAKLATGIKRFKLPDEFNFIKIYQEQAKPGSSQALEANRRLANVFTDRRQYPKAAEYLQRAIELAPGDTSIRQALAQIVGNWGRFENATVYPAGQGPTLEFVFRNGKQVEFEAWEIKVPQLLDDVKNYLKNNPKQVDWNKTQLQNIGHRLVWENERTYLGARVAQWDLKLEPRANHFDKRVTVTTPLQKAGAYLVTGKLADGNVSRIIVWVADTVLVKKQLANQTWYFAADAVTGKPVPKANVEFFGWKQMQVGNQNQWNVTTSNFAEFTDADGQILVGPQRMPREYQWIAVARTEADKRFAFLGFSGVWYSPQQDQEYNQVKAIVITDRPVYRPGQPVKFKFWIRHAKYDQPDTSDFAGRQYPVVITNQLGEEVYNQVLKTDEFAGLEGEYLLPKDAKLGQFHVHVKNQQFGGGGTFRVEEYKKPEFEVNVEAPKDPVQLGEKITATIKAKYYFGAPVTQAKVKYKITRTKHTEQWHPIGRWDWFYGRGYWWFASDYYWYPGWSRWGCGRPYPTWWNRSFDPPELVAEREVQIGEDGTVKVEIDTAVAKAMHGKDDHQYAISAEVVDQSRRTIVGTGNVMVARQPFRVFAWVDRGYYRTAETIEASFTAHTLDQKPVAGKGELKLFQITYNDKREPVETAVETWQVNTDAEGRASQKIKAGAPGQYRLSYKLTDKQQHTEEGGYIFVIRGDGFNGAKFRFNDVELITDKQEYAAGEKVKLLVNTDRINGTVALFLRPSNNIYSAPQIIRLDGKSTQVELDVGFKDMPNFYIEAITVSNGKLHTEMREVIVPPEQRVLNVQVTPSATEFQPGAPAKIKVKVTDLSGKPFQGSTVLTMYDKSLEYISGGSNVPEIKAFFWKWRRQHHPQSETNLNWSFTNLFRPNEAGMGFLGAFGASVADDDAAAGAESDFAAAKGLSKADGVSQRGGRFGGMGGGGRLMLAEARAPGAMPQSRMRKSAAANGAETADAKRSEEQSESAEVPLAEPTVRSKFADSAFWAGSLKTDADGLAEVSLTMPENLTAWKIKTWTMGHGTKVGQAEAEVVTKKNLLVRLQAPRFFVQKDEVVLSANVHNYLKEKKTVTVVLEIDELSGAQATPMQDKISREKVAEQAVDPAGGGRQPVGAAVIAKAPAWSIKKQIEIEAGGEARVDWRIHIDQPGEIVIRMKALTDVESDAMQQQFPVYVHGMSKMDSYAGVIRPNQESASIKIQIPKERRISDSRIEVRYSPTLAGAMVDALPYLVDFPYGCTEQTINRFVPTVITQNILLKMNLDLKAIQEKRTNLNAQEIGDDPARAKGWKRYDREPVFDKALVADMVKEGVKTLTEQQLSDGGWGWFSGFGEHSWPHTTAVVVHGLQVAKQNDVAMVPGMLERGIEWLKRYQAEQVQRIKNFVAKSKDQNWKEHADNLDALVYMILADADIADVEMRDFLYRDRVQLAAYAKAVYGLALHKQQQQEKLTMILQNLDQFLVQDEENQTAYLKLPADNWWWSWYGSEIEANAYYLKLLSKTDGKGERASRLVKYLLNNRKHATYWNSTRDTALCIEAMADFLVASGEAQPDLTIEVFVDGQKKKEVQVNSKNLFSFDNRFELIGDAISDGEHVIELKKKGTGSVYFNAYVTNFTLEDFITKAGLEIKVNRKFYKLTRVDKSTEVANTLGQVVQQKVDKYKREELANLAKLKSGDLVEVELEIDSKNDYEYLLFEDMKASGFEPVDVRSGYNGNDLGAYMELRDERVAFFVRALSRGKHSVSYRLRAEIPGKFSALPTKASAMYAPELRGNSDEMKLQVED